ncbi:TlpA family protein disulfide reductase [Nocardioides pocheonensis]|uniref:TlpA family protein disulfide reductase n=1 Tax=Nocardioides pocheonensis TaxID=661485 RepID=UPI00161CA9A0|nr:TlpA disulfide reductase family protein [Nocardioides pocheonensis]
MSRVAALLLVALLLTGCGSAPKQAAPARLPDVTLASLTGGPGVDLGSLRGPAVVNLWAQWCKPCKRELPIYESFYQRHGAQVSVLGVDWQDVQADRARALAQRSGVTYPLVVDSKPAIRNRFLPQLLLVDSQGRIAFHEYIEITSLDQLERLVEKHLGVSL